MVLLTSWLTNCKYIFLVLNPKTRNYALLITGFWDFDLADKLGNFTIILILNNGKKFVALFVLWPQPR